MDTELAVAIVAAAGTVITAVLVPLVVKVKQEVNGRMKELLDRIAILEAKLLAARHAEPELAEDGWPKER